mgnify:FL=1
MKKIIFILSLLAGMLTFTGCDEDKIISESQLPQKAQQFIQQYFAEEEIDIVKSEREVSGKKYEVTFISGKNIEFKSNGDWIKVDCLFSAVPAELVPEAIANKVKEMYPDAIICVIDKENNYTEVDLNNGLDLKFDKKYNLISIDD